jgi:hypothetical protein
MLETQTLRQIWLAVARTTTLFRLNTGMAWASGGGKVIKRADGAAIVPFGRPIALGFSKPDNTPLVGASDLIGWHTIVITEEMVGTRVAVFTAIEVKRTGGGRRRPEQITFIDNVRADGGIAGFASSPDDAIKIISDWFPPIN